MLHSKSVVILPGRSKKGHSPQTAQNEDLALRPGSKQDGYIKRSTRGCQSVYMYLEMVSLRSVLALLYPSPFRIHSVHQGQFEQVRVHEMLEIQAALREFDGYDWGGSILRVGWSKAVPIAAKPMYGKRSSSPMLRYNA